MRASTETIEMTETKIISFILAILPIGWWFFDSGFWHVFFIIIQMLAVCVLAFTWYLDRDQYQKAWMTSTSFPIEQESYEDAAMIKSRLSTFITNEIKNTENSVLESRISKFKEALHKGKLIAYRKIETELFQIIKK